MRKFVPVKGYEEKCSIPKRSTKNSAGYDIIAAKDTIVPSFWKTFFTCVDDVDLTLDKQYTLKDHKELIKKINLQATLVPTGFKVYCDENEYVSFVPRSSIATKNLLFIPNSPSTIDSDYADNPDNEGHCFVPLLNFSPYDIIIKKGDRFAQAIFSKYEIVDDDDANGERSGGFGSTGS